MSKHIYKQICLPIYDITVTLYENDENLDISGVITSRLHDDLDNGSQIDVAVDAIESLILAHACANADIETGEYINGSVSAIETIFDRWD